MADESIIPPLLLKRLQGTLTPEEATLLNEWKAVSIENEQLFNKITDGELLQEQFSNYYKYRVQTNQRLQEAIEASKIIRIKRWISYAAAVIIAIGMGVTVWLLNTDHLSLVTKTSNTHHQNPLSTKKPILTLADGKKIELDGTQSDYKKSLPAMEGTVSDPREAGQKPGVGENYNTITTPRGLQYQVILPDGTKAWLNAQSSITFPTAFITNQRAITVTGEVYLEVKKDPKKSFSVKVNNQPDIIVIGTSFNVSAYENDKNFKASLVEGAIKVDDQLVKPGQAYNNGQIITTDLDQDIAWKNGLFNFTDLPLTTVMNQLARWYDVDIIYEGKLPAYGFSGKMGRDLSLREMVNALSGVEGLRLRIEGKSLIVSTQ